MKDKKNKLVYYKNPLLTNKFAPGGFLGSLNKLGNKLLGEDDSYSGKGLNAGGMSIANAGASIVGSIGNSMINKDGLSHGVGDIMSTAGGLASMIPGVGGLIGAGVNVLGGITNKAFGSKINQEFVDNTEMGIKQLGNTQYMGNTTDALMDEFSSTNFMNDVTRNQVGKDGWFANKAKKKANKLNTQIAEAEQKALTNFGISTSNLATNNILTGLSNYYSEGGLLSSYPDKKQNPIKKEKELDFDSWYKTVPKDRNDTTSYNLKRAYELTPKEEIEQWRKASPKELQDGNKHLRTVYENPETGEYEFMKSKNHPALQKELDWYNSNTPEAYKFRSKYKLDTSKDYYKYIPKKDIENQDANKFSIGGNLLQGMLNTNLNVTIPELNPRMKFFEEGGTLDTKQASLEELLLLNRALKNR